MDEASKHYKLGDDLRNTILEDEIIDFDETPKDYKTVISLKAIVLKLFEGLEDDIVNGAIKKEAIDRTEFSLKDIKTDTSFQEAVLSCFKGLEEAIANLPDGEELIRKRKFSLKEIREALQYHYTLCDVDGFIMTTEKLDEKFTEHWTEMRKYLLNNK